MTDLFSEAARDVEAERFAERCAGAKVAVADLWPFLALAGSGAEFDHRLALAHEHIATRTDPDLLDITLTALKSDFAELEQLRAEEVPVTPKVAAVQPAPLQPGLQFFHHDQQRWITMQAALPTQPDTRDNPYGQGPNYFENAAEEGPNTGQTGQYPQFPAGPDPVDPLNGLFPMQPSTWTVPPDAGWVERPMQLSPPDGGRKQGYRPSMRTWGLTSSVARSVAARVLASAGYTDEGVQTGPGPNPAFFSGGSEGIGGDPQAGYPTDLAVQDPDDRVNEIYGAVPPQPSTGSGQGGAAPYSNPATARQASFFDPHDLGVRVVAQGAVDVDSSGAGMAPEPPQSMIPGGVGSIAQDPLSPGPTSTGGMDPSGADAASKSQMVPGNGRSGIAHLVLDGTRTRSASAQNTVIDIGQIARMAADTIRQRPSDLNPSGVPDEYDDRTWEGGAQTHPRQPAEDRGINTPQTPRDPIPQATSTDIQRELSEDEERLRQATRRAEQAWISQLAAQVVRTHPMLVGGGMR